MFPARRLLSLCLILAFALAAVLPSIADDLGQDRERYRNMLNLVSKDIEKNFYDPALKGLDWKALTEQARQKIDAATSPGAMLTAIYALTDKLQDSHTKFIPPSHVYRPLFGFEAKAFGDAVRIYQIKKGSAADKAGLRVGDRILDINGFGAERNSFDLMMLYFRYLRPVPAMKITYQRGSAPEANVVVEAKIKQDKAVVDLTTGIDLWELIEEYLYLPGRYDHSAQFPDGIGYMEVLDFGTEEVGIVHTLEKEKAVIVDLRGNGGGYQMALLELAGHFEPEATTMGDMVTRKKSEPLKIKPHKPNFAVPMVILVDSRSASASEMFARHFQRTGRATIVGDRSSGRVNSSLFFPEELGTSRVVMFGAQIAVGKVVFPGGEELEHNGVKPDVPCLPGESDLSEHRDPCMFKAVSVARQKIGLPPELPSATSEQVAAVAARIAADKQKRLDEQKD